MRIAVMFAAGERTEPLGKLYDEMYSEDEGNVHFESIECIEDNLDDQLRYLLSSFKQNVAEYLGADLGDQR